MNGPKPKRHPWRWALLPQEGRFHLAIHTIALGDKTLLAYSGIGDGERCSELTNMALAIMGRYSGGKHVFMDLRKSMKPEPRVRSAFEMAEDEGIVMFMSPDDPSSADVMEVILKGKRMEPIR